MSITDLLRAHFAASSTMCSFCISLSFSAASLATFARRIASCAQARRRHCCYAVAIMCGAESTAVGDKGRVCMLMLCYLFFHLFLLAFPRLRHAPSQAVDEVGLLHEPGQHGGGNAMPAQLAHCGGGAPFDAAQTV